jgi:hypothetical protein
MYLEAETAARQDGRIILGKLADSTIAIDVNDTYSIGTGRIRNQAKGYGSTLLQEVLPVCGVLLHNLCLGLRHVLSKGWAGRNQLAEKGCHIGILYLSAA